MAVSIGSSSLSWLASSCRSNHLTRLAKGLFDRQEPGLTHLSSTGRCSQVIKAKRQPVLLAATEDHSSENELTSHYLEQDDDAENLSSESSLVLSVERTVGKPGFISFHGRSIEKREEMHEPPLGKHQSNLIFFMGPSVLVASFIFPSLYLRKILSSIFEDSLLTDFLILFFTEVLFYFGVAVFLLLIDRLQKPPELIYSPKGSGSQTTQLVHRISSVATLVLSLIIPMVTMGLVWPWTGPAASATLAPYLVGIVVQFAFEQYAKYVKSRSWPVIPIIFQVYRLHQLNRAAQLVTALSFTVRGAETTSHNLAINRSLGTLLNVLQFLGVICIWSLASFLTRFLPSDLRPLNDQSWTLKFGSIATFNDAITTPSFRNSRIAIFYYVGLTGVSVGGQMLPISSSVFATNLSGSGGVLVDSGAVVTRFRPEYVCQGLPTTGRFGLFDTCFDLTSRTTVKVPSVAFSVR
ncbi:hypothetical protein IFM89_017868 [Coptis chinensis]|uniref:Xylanase inhibitor C-terminal domain-containing protein n=1 Tax=Coptis chinensis TaxID=261450 RepID=A0A835IWF7_9MAGN|nr:hypothetical protein IFM89_017868 [Coptis chinensis]